MPLRSPVNQRAGYNISVVAIFSELETPVVIPNGGTALLPMQVEVYDIGIFALEVNLEGDFIASNNSDISIQIEILVDGQVAYTSFWTQGRASSGAFAFSRTWWLQEDDFTITPTTPGVYPIQVRVTDTGQQTSTTVGTNSELQTVGPFR